MPGSHTTKTEPRKETIAKKHYEMGQKGPKRNKGNRYKRNQMYEGHCRTVPRTNLDRKQNYSIIRRKGIKTKAYLLNITRW